MSMSGYTKLFNSILASTIWREDNITRIVWITLLAMADKNGIAEGSIPGLADFARVSVDECRAALTKLSAPDADSRSQEHDGRRIEAVDGGWQLLNHAKYRAKLNADERREYNRIKKAEERQQKSASVKHVNDTSALSAHTEAEADTEADPKAEAATTPRGSSALIVSPLQFDRLKQKNAFVGSRLRIPHVLHDELRTKLGADGEAKLQAWYLTLDEAVEASGEAIPDIFTWLRPRFVAWCESQGVVKPATNGKSRHATPAQSRQEQATARVKELIALGKSRQEAMEMASQEFGL